MGWRRKAEVDEAGLEWPGHGVPPAPQATGAAGTVWGSARLLLRAAQGWLLMPGHFSPAFLQPAPVPQKRV